MSCLHETYYFLQTRPKGFRDFHQCWQILFAPLIRPLGGMEKKTLTCVQYIGQVFASRHCKSIKLKSKAVSYKKKYARKRIYQWCSVQSEKSVPRVMFRIIRQASWCQTVTLGMEFSVCISHSLKNLIFLHTWVWDADWNTVPRVTVRHHNACRVTPNNYSEERIFNSASRVMSNSYPRNGCFSLCIKRKILIFLSTYGVSSESGARPHRPDYYYRHLKT